jgi:hypothetical protein
MAPVWQPNRAQWRVIWITTVLLIAAWPATEGGSLGVKAVRWLTDPSNTLPSFPKPLPMGLGDDGDAVAAHDRQEAEYYRIYESSRMMRMRLRLQAAKDPSSQPLTADPDRRRDFGRSVCVAVGCPGKAELGARGINRIIESLVNRSMTQPAQ